MVTTPTGRRSVRGYITTNSGSGARPEGYEFHAYTYGPSNGVLPDWPDYWGDEHVAT